MQKRRGSREMPSRAGSPFYNEDGWQDLLELPDIPLQLVPSGQSACFTQLLRQRLFPFSSFVHTAPSTHSSVLLEVTQSSAISARPQPSAPSMPTKLSKPKHASPRHFTRMLMPSWFRCSPDGARTFGEIPKRFFLVFARCLVGTRR